MRELSVSAASEPLEELDLVDAAAQVSAWCGEPLLYEGDDPAITLAPGTARDPIARSVPAWSRARKRSASSIGSDRSASANSA